MHSDDISRGQFVRELKTVSLCVPMRPRGAFKNISLKDALEMDLLTY